MNKVRISEVAEELGLTSKEVITHANEINIKAKAANSAIDLQEADMLMKYILNGVKPSNLETNSKKSLKDEGTKQTSKKEEKKESAKREIKAEKTPQKEKESKKTEPKKEKVVTKSKEEVAKEIQKDTPSVAKASLRKRRGLVIVNKKKKPEPKVETTTEKKESLSMPESIPGIKKKTKKAKKTPATSKSTNTKKLDILGGEIASIEILPEEEMVVLHDFTVKDEPKEESKKKKVDVNRVRTAKSASFIQQRGISRKSMKKKKKPKVKETAVVTNVDIPEDIRVYEFAEKLQRPVSDVIKVLFNLGVMVTKNDFLDKDAI